MKHISEKRLRDILNNQNSGRSAVIMFGGQWCSNCKALKLALQSEKLPDEVDMYYYDINVSEVEDSDSYIMKDLPEIIGNSITNLPSFIYIQNGGISSGGMVPSTTLVRKINNMI